MPYHIRLRGQQQGPFSAEQLQKLAARGRFSRSYEVSTDEGQSWQRAEAFPELFPTPAHGRRTEPAPAAAATAQQAGSASQEPGEEWYYTHAGAELGPVATEEFKRLIGLGQVLAEDHVWTEGMDHWKRVRDVPELARQLSSAAASAVAAPAAVTIAPMAVASFILGLLGFTLITSLLAVVFGHIALSQIRQGGGKLGGKGLAITGLVLGYLVIIPSVIVAIVVLAILALAPSGSRVTSMVDAAWCWV
jgi:hypothetical protein